MAVYADPSVIECPSVGSTIVVALYDHAARKGGLAHFLLPTAREGLSSDRQATFVDTGFPALLQLMVQHGCLTENLVALYAGGAQFRKALADDALDIGVRNIRAVEQALAKAQIQVHGSHQGGAAGRSLFFDVSDGTLTVQTLSGAKILDFPPLGVAA